VREQICLDFLAADLESKNIKKIVQELQFGETSILLIVMQ
jgi:hypothetical protein